MAKVEPIEPYLESVRKSVVVPRPPAEAFEIFTGRLAEWWPLARFSIHEAEAATCVLEPRVGGRAYEITRDGREGEWGKVLVWDPPHRLVLSWHPGNPPEDSTELELRFLTDPGGTRVELEHRNWTRLGARAKQTREQYNSGWAEVFEHSFKEACA